MSNHPHWGEKMSNHPHWPAMAFEDRQKEWTGFYREFRQHNGRGDRPNVWTIEVRGDRVHTTHGLLNGAIQSTDYQGKIKNKGRANEISAESDALAEARRDCRKKWEFEGYDEYLDGQNIDRRNIDRNIDALLTNLPGSFCLYKPENNLFDCSKLLAKAKKGEVWYTLKRDGMAKLVVSDYYGSINIYSRRARLFHDKEGPTERGDGTLDYSTVISWRERFPHLVEAVRDLKLPPGSMIAGELVFPYQGKDDFKYISSLTKSYSHKAIEDMSKLGCPFLYVWDIPFLCGEDIVRTRPFHERIKIFKDLWDVGGPSRKWLIPLVIEQFGSPEEAVAVAKDRGIEGWVVVDPNAVYGDKGWNLKGKPDRPSTCAKLKPRYEDDFIAKWDPDNKIGEWGTGKHERGKLVTLPDGSQVTHGGVGSFALYQLNEAGEEIYICDCSSGMDYTFQANLRKECFPLTVAVEYVERTYISDGEKTNALRFPTFVRCRTDKTPSECINSRL